MSQNKNLLYRIKLRLNKKAFNKILVMAGFEKHVKTAGDFWKNYNVVQTKSDQEVAGYSHIPVIDDAINHTHKLVQDTFNKHVGKHKSAKVLDIGCGPGTYLKDFETNVVKYGIDLNTNMLVLAKKNNPEATLIEGEFLKMPFTDKFDMIYSIGVLQYFTPGELATLLSKAASLLNPNGILLISYPHALSKEDLSYPDINYINYSPKLLNRVASKYLTVLYNRHIIQDRSIDEYDTSPIAPPNGLGKTYLNSSIFIGQRTSK